jgi:nicotinamidase-related amidase
MPRVWDSFITAQDKASLGDRPHQVWGYGERPALLCVDLYRWVFGDRRQPLLEAMKTWPGSCGEAAWDAIPHVERLLGAARAARIPVVHATKMSPYASGIAAWSEKPAANRAAAKPDGNKWDIIDEAAPLPGETVIYKAAPSAFFGTLLMAQLNALDVDSLIICGESTSGCVRATVVDGRSNRFKMTVVEEAVFDRHQATHAINLFDMHEKYADVLGIDEVVAHLNALRPASAAVPA